MANPTQFDIPDFPEFSWSVTRYNGYASCPRQYYHQYYGGWQGWQGGKRQNDEQARQTYFWSKRETIPTWSGKLIHEAIARMLNGNGTEAAKKQAIDMCREDWRISARRGEILREKGVSACTNPKLILLMEHVDQQPSREIVDEVEIKITESLDAFLELGILDEFTAARNSPDRYSFAENPDAPFRPKRLEIRDPDTGQTVNVWSMLDCAYEDKPGQCVIYDWKTGQLMQGADESRLTDQLIVYGCYVCGPDGMNTRPENIAIEAYEMFLPEGRALGGKVTLGDMSDVKKRIIAQSFELMQVHNRIQEIGEIACSASPSEKKCLNCQFRKICSESWVKEP